jgi:hypothetical protein
MSFKDLSSPKNAPAKYKSDNQIKGAPAADQPATQPDKTPAEVAPAPKS